MTSNTPIERCRCLLAGVLALALSSCGYQRFLADLEIEKLCKLDGGVRVVEHDNPPTEFLRPDGTINLQKIDIATPLQSYFIKHEVTYIQRHTPQIVRIEDSLYRGIDKKLLGVSIAYMRPNDHSYDFSPFPTSKACPENGAGLPLVSEVFRTRATNY